MADEDYSAYLKKQSYDDLVSISYTINRETQAERYSMVLAEIAEREKHGERKDNKPRCSYVVIAVGLLFAVIGLIEVCTGSAYNKYHHEITITQNPVGFWFSVGVDFTVAAIGLYCGFKYRK
jgi:hypothetical protein